jgi:hypothetical protein
MGIVSLLSCAGEKPAAGESPADAATEPGVEKFSFVPCDDAPANAEVPGAVDGGVLERDAELPTTGAGLNEKLDDDAALEAALLAEPGLAKEKLLAAPELENEKPCPIFANVNCGTLVAAVEADEFDPSELAEPNAGCARPRTLGAPNAGLPTAALADEALGVKENDGVELLFPKSPPEGAVDACDDQLPNAGALLAALKEIFADAPGKLVASWASFFGAGALAFGCAGVSFCSLHQSTAGSSLYFLSSILHSFEKSSLYLSLARMSRICCSVFSLSYFS